MEQCFKIVLGMFVLIGSLQANPISNDSTKKLSLRFNIVDMGFKYIKEEVTCGPNVTFITPTDVERICYTKALDVFIEGLKQAMANCTDENDRVGSALELIQYVYPESAKLTIPAQSLCFEESRKQSAEFLNTLESFLKMLNN